MRSVEAERPATCSLLSNVEELTFNEVRVHGVLARRTTIHFGWSNDYERWSIEPAVPPPEWLEPLIVRIADGAGIERRAIEQAIRARISTS